MIVTCVDNNNDSHEEVIQRGRLTAPTNAKFLTLDYMKYINHFVLVSVTFSRDDCMSSSSRSVMCESTCLACLYNTVLKGNLVLLKMVGLMTKPNFAKLGRMHILSLPID